jgi:hypothetical protein
MWYLCEDKVLYIPVLYFYPVHKIYLHLAYLGRLSNTGIPQFMKGTYSMKTVRKVWICKLKIIFSLLYM